VATARQDKDCIEYSPLTAHERNDGMRTHYWAFGMTVLLLTGAVLVAQDVD
jgi:hypothetical protein